MEQNGQMNEVKAVWRIAYFSQKYLLYFEEVKALEEVFTQKLFFLKAKIDSNPKHLMKCFLRIGGEAYQWNSFQSLS